MIIIIYYSTVYKDTFFRLYKYISSEHRQRCLDWLKIGNWVRIQGLNTRVQLVLTSMTVSGASLPKSLTYTLAGDEITDIRLEVGDFKSPRLGKLTSCTNNQS